MLTMVTEKDMKKLGEIGEALAETDEDLVKGLLEFRSGLEVGIVIGMAKAYQDMDKEYPRRNQVK